MLSDSIKHVKCKTCGEYFIENHLSEVIPTHQKYKCKRYILSGILREASEHKNPIKITENNIQDILDSASIPDTPFEKIDRLVLYVHRHSPTAASVVNINADRDYPIAYAKDTREFSFYVNKAVELGYLENRHGQYRLTLDGWTRLDELRKKQVKSNQAFVAMWFPDENKKREAAWKDKLETAWSEGFKPALEDTGYNNPIRIDLVEHNEKICNRIIAEIRKSGLLVADFTGNRGGVYFEAGFAKGLGTPVIWTCHKEYEKKIHFDTRQYNHIFWENPRELKEKLVNRIEAEFPNRLRNR
jgi:nucleoside 2-deoxyribosyltransferase